MNLEAGSCLEDPELNCLVWPSQASNLSFNNLIRSSMSIVERSADSELGGAGASVSMWSGGVLGLASLGVGLGLAGLAVAGPVTATVSSPVPSRGSLGLQSPPTFTVRD